MESTEIQIFREILENGPVLTNFNMSTTISTTSSPSSASVAATASILSSDGFLEDEAHDPYVSRMGFGWDLSLGMVILVIIILGFTLNGLVLWTLVKSRHNIRRNSHSNTEYFIIALAASDFLVVIVCYPVTMASTVSHRWLLGHVGCSINGFFGFLFSLIDVGVLAIMSVVRLLSVKMPHCALARDHRYTIGAIMGVVLYALMWTVPPLFGWGQYAPEPFGTSCTVAWASSHRSYVTTIFTCVLAVPLMMMFVSYGSLVYHMRVRSARVGRQFVERRRRAKRQNRLIRMAVLMCLVFLITWLPYSVLSICYAYVPKFDVKPVYSAIPTLLAKSGHVINPVIYFTMNPSYRDRIKLRIFGQNFSSRTSTTRLSRSRNMKRSKKEESNVSRLGSTNIQLTSFKSYLQSTTLPPEQTSQSSREDHEFQTRVSSGSEESASLDKETPKLPNVVQNGKVVVENGHCFSANCSYEHKSSNGVFNNGNRSISADIDVTDKEMYTEKCDLSVNHNDVDDSCRSVLRNSHNMIRNGHSVVSNGNGVQKNGHSVVENENDVQNNGHFNSVSIQSTNMPTSMYTGKSSRYKRRTSDIIYNRSTCVTAGDLKLSSSVMAIPALRGKHNNWIYLNKRRSLVAHLESSIYSRDKKFLTLDQQKIANVIYNPTLQSDKESNVYNENLLIAASHGKQRSPGFSGNNFTTGSYNCVPDSSIMLESKPSSQVSSKESNSFNCLSDCGRSSGSLIVEYLPMENGNVFKEYNTNSTPVSGESIDNNNRMI